MPVNDEFRGFGAEFFPPIQTDPRDRPRIGVGLHTDVAHEHYHVDPCETPSLSSGVVRRLVDESPLHAHLIHPRLGGHSATHYARVLDRGTMIHLLLLGKGQEFVEVEADSYKTQAARAARDGAYAEGKVPVLSRELEEYMKVVRIFKAKLLDQVDDDGNPDPIEFDGDSELTGVWRDEDGVLCRLRADHWRAHRREILDLKSTDKSVSPRACASTLVGNGGDIQHEHYTRGMTALAGEGEPIRMRYVFLEMKPPYDVVVVEPDGTLMELGARRWRRGRDRWRASLTQHMSAVDACACGAAKGRTHADFCSVAWPGHSRGRTIKIAAPKWAQHQDLDAEIASFVPDKPEF
jgi:hypothetical protein